jgi:Lipoxygenase
MIRNFLDNGLKLLILKAEDVPGIRRFLDAIDWTHQPTRLVKGRLVYADDLGKPLHNVKLELWDRDLGTTRLGQWLGSGRTDRDGRFLIRYSPKKAGILDTPDLRLKVIEQTPFYSDSPNHPRQLNYRERSVYEIKGPDNVTDAEYDFWEQPVPYWCYRDDAPGAPPRLAMTKLQIIIEGVDTEFRKQLRRLTKHYQGIVFRQSLFPEAVAAVQALFLPLSRTQVIEQRKPGLSRSDAYFADRILNGMNPGLFRQGANANQLRLVYNWDAYAAAKNPDYDLHNVEVVFALPAVSAPVELTGAAAELGKVIGALMDARSDRLIDEPTDKLEQDLRFASSRQSSNQSYSQLFNQSSSQPVSPPLDAATGRNVSTDRLMPIGITIETTGADGIKQPPIIYRPGDPLWEQAKRIVRTNVLFSGELIAHFIQGHLQTEQFAIAAFRNLRANPVHLLLFPHLKGVAHVNFRADKTLVGPNGFISQAGPLLWEEGLKPLCQDVMGQLDWDRWTPRQLVHSRHRYADVAQQFWQILDDYVAGFLKEHHREICQEWFEIQAMSDDLITHSVVYKPDPITDWADQNEASKPPRQKANATGPIKALSPITETSQPQPGDLEHLKQFCKYAIFHATLWHSWVNDGQVDDGGEIAYSSLALRNGSFSHSANPEADEEIAPTPYHAAQQLALMHILTKASYGYIVSNEDVDIPPLLIELLKQKEQEFGRSGERIKNIRSLINI